MNATLKILLLWLLMLVLPLQGFAAAARPVCDTASHHDAIATTAAHAGGADAATRAEHSDRDHLHIAPCSNDDAGAASSASCQKCCTSAAMPPSGMNWLLPQRANVQPETAPDLLFTGHISSGLERPPRHII